uniref:Interleukin 1 receptor associated kinase 4 n=1 Tax=Salmo trutta TaxID=8032 RepID=A0A673W924_SALTR
VRQKFSDYLDPQESWKDVLVSIHKPTGEPKYSQVLHCGRGGILMSHRLMAAASILLPGMLRSTCVFHQRSSIDCLFHSLSFQELKKITGHFDERPVSDDGSRLGEGSFGTVYKGLINGKPVAVRKLLSMEDISLEELNVQCNHPCFVYAYMSNGSLLDWLACLTVALLCSGNRRCLTALGTARGLDYLHSIFINKCLSYASAMWSSSTLMTERIVGTTAYMLNEAFWVEITPKSSIYSFWVVLLEILSGVLPVDENRDPKFLVSKQNNGSFLFSTRLSSSYSGMNAYDLKKENI